MNRRSFWGTMAGSAALLAGNTTIPDNAEAAASSMKIAGKTLPELREEHRYWLFNDFLPFMDKFVIDHELGGFMCTADRDGTQINSDKRGWYEGRGIWVYSYLYNKLAKEQKYLDVADKSVKFIMKYKPSGDKIWPETYKRDGTNNGMGDTRLYGDMFVALGLQEYSKATGDNQYWNLAKETILKDVRLYDRPDYEKTGVRVSGVWMCLINTISGALEKKSDPELEKVLNRSIDAIFNYHYNPEFQLDNEELNHDMSRDPKTANSAFLGHPIETFWMIMYEAIRRKDKKMFALAAERFHRHAEVAWDNVYGGVYEGLDDVAKNIFSLRKVLWEQGEVLVGSLCVYEHTGAPWALEMYERMYTYVLDKFPLKKYGYHLWMEWGDRKMTFQPHASRVEHFHHPRHLMLNMLALDRMIKRGGRPSGLMG
jgi:N-acylglucosamine 2-epimerase